MQSSVISPKFRRSELCGTWFESELFTHFAPLERQKWPNFWSTELLFCRTFCNPNFSNRTMRIRTFLLYGICFYCDVEIFVCFWYMVNDSKKWTMMRISVCTPHTFLYSKIFLLNTYINPIEEGMKKMNSTEAHLKV